MWIRAAHSKISLPVWANKSVSFRLVNTAGWSYYYSNMHIRQRKQVILHCHWHKHPLRWKFYWQYSHLPRMNARAWYNSIRYTQPFDANNIAIWNSWSFGGAPVAKVIAILKLFKWTTEHFELMQVSVYLYPTFIWVTTKTNKHNTMWKFCWKISFFGTLAPSICRWYSCRAVSKNFDDGIRSCCLLFITNEPTFTFLSEKDK